MSPRPKILVIAEAANPEWVSVPLVGWSITQALGKVADVHLVTHIRNKEAIERAGLIEGVDFTSIDSESVARPLWGLSEMLRMGKDGGWTLVTAFQALSYQYFEYLIWKRFSHDLKGGKYDIVHRITPLSPAINSPIAPKCRKIGIPFVVGPINGGVAWPKGFEAERRREREWLSYVRGIYKLLPGRGRMLKSAAGIIAGSKCTQSEIPKKYLSKIVYLPENAIDPDRFNLKSEQVITLPIRCCFIGRFVPLKGVDMLLEAAAPLLRDGRLVLDIVGDGPLMDHLKALTEREGISGSVKFHGWLPHSEVQSVAVRSNLLTLPSIREFGGGVILEAMTLGVVPVVVDYGGPGELVSEDIGFKVPIGSREDIINSLRRSLEAVSENPNVLPLMAERARKRARSLFTWNAKAQQILTIYDWVLGVRQGRPDPMATTAHSGHSAKPPLELSSATKEAKGSAKKVL